MTSLRAKLVRTMVITLTVVCSATLLVVAGMNYLSARQTLRTIESHLRASIENKGTGLVTNQAIALRDLVADNAFGDVGRLVDRTVERDQQVVYGLFIDSEDKAWGFSAQKGSGLPSDWKQLKLDVERSRTPGVKIASAQAAALGVFLFSTPVVDDRGSVLGSLFYALSAAPLEKALADARGDSRRSLAITVGLLLLLGAAAAVIGSLLSRAAAARITRPVTELTQAVNTLAGGRRDIRVSISSGDELQMLGNAFNNMVAELQDYYQRLEGMNRTLELKVEERTRELADRNRDMRLVLDNVSQGFLTISPNGRLAQEHSAIFDEWFGGYGPDTMYADHMQKVDPLYASSFAVGFDALIADILPRELCIEQLPARVRRGGREYRCSYSPILKGEQLDGLLIVINDVTNELLHARQEAERQEILSMFEALTRDRTGFLAFIDDAEELMAQLPRAALVDQKRILHTIKGNAGLSGFNIVASLCHQMEDELGERAEPLSADELVPLTQRWHQLTEALKRFLGDKGRDVIELRAEEVHRLEEEVRAGAPQERVLERLTSWWLESTTLPLTRLGRYAVALAGRLGKGQVKLEIQSNGVRLAPKAWAGFWTDLVHVIRNAVDHGLESPHERDGMGKPCPAQLRLSTAIVGRKLLVEVEDDGRGIDWEAVQKAAKQRGLPADSESDLHEALFAAGLTTREQVTTLSGRGVGLSAVRQQVADLGGTISVVTKKSQGTCFRFSFSFPAIGPQYGVGMEGGESSKSDEKPPMHSVAPSARS